MGSESIETVRVSRSSSSSPGKSFPPGFRFHPTDEELVLYYLKRKMCRRSLKLDIIGEVDVYKWDPEELPGLSKLKTGDRQWFFFSPRDRKYPNGGRSNRATMHGYWKATGKDRIIKCGSRSAGIKKTLVYYQGRAPSGQRTDWVMHEYTLDEEELKRCQFAQEYYALYKVFKKSGPGPKNGEQYGAPFVEEEWNDDDCLEVDALLVQNINSEKQLQLFPVESAKIIPQEDEPLFTNDIVEFLNKIVDEPDISPPPAEIDYPSVETKSRDCLNESSIDQWKAMCSSNEHHDMQPGSEVAQSAQEASEVSSITNVHVREPKPLMVCKDFLEMDDLIGPQPVESLDKPVAQNMQFAHSDGLAEFEFYHDSSRFYNELLPFESQQIPQAYYMNNLEYGMENSDFHSRSEGTGSEVVNYQLHEENEMSYNLWTHDQGNSDFPTAGATQEAISPPSGVVIDENLGKPNSQVNQCPITKEDDGTDSWFSSALWAFVESIPTTPASASESSALVNRAFERMSSFSRGRNVNEAAAVVNSALASRRLERSSRSNRGIIYFSVLGVLFAILWVFVGSSIEFLGRCISR